MRTKEAPARARQPANTPQAAQQRYVGYLQRSLGCISKAVWATAEPIRSSGDQSVLTLPNEEPIILKTASGGRVGLFAAQRFVIVPDEENPGEFKTRTREYIYHAFDRPDAEPAVQWHWHPHRNVQFAHIHANFPDAQAVWGDRSPAKLHIPSSRVAFEDVVRFLIQELDVVPRDNDWEAVLSEAMDAFLEWRTWSGSAPPGRSRTGGGGPATPEAIEQPKDPVKPGCSSAGVELFMEAEGESQPSARRHGSPRHLRSDPSRGAAASAARAATLPSRLSAGEAWR